MGPKNTTHLIFVQTFAIPLIQCMRQIPRVWDFNMSSRAQFTIFGNFVVAKFSAARGALKGGATSILYWTNQPSYLCQHNYISQFNIQYHYWACYLIKVSLWTITWTGMNKLSIYHSLKDLKVHQSLIFPRSSCAHHRFVFLAKFTNCCAGSLSTHHPPPLHLSRFFTILQ